MNIDHPAVQAFAAIKMPYWTPQARAKCPDLYKKMIGMLYFDPEAPFEVKVALQIPQHPSELRNRADRQKHMIQTLERTE